MIWMSIIKENETSFRRCGGGGGKEEVEEKEKDKEVLGRQDKKD